MRQLIAIALLVGCGGSSKSSKYCSMPITAQQQPQLFVLTGGAAADGTASSAADLQARVGMFASAGGQQDPRMIVVPVDETAALPTFIATIDFTHSDVAIFASGGERGALRGLVQETPTKAVALFSTGCAPCGGGDPGSYEMARQSYEASRLPSTSLAVIAKGSTVTVAACNVACGACDNRIP